MKNIAIGLDFGQAACSEKQFQALVWRFFRLNDSTDRVAAGLCGRE